MFLMYQQLDAAMHIIKLTSNEILACNAELNWLMCAAYNNYLQKSIKAKNVKENGDPSIVGRIVTPNVFKDMKNWNFVTLVVGSNLFNFMISKVKEFFKGGS